MTEDKDRRKERYEQRKKAEKKKTRKRRIRDWNEFEDKRSRKIDYSHVEEEGYE